MSTTPQPDSPAPTQRRTKPLKPEQLTLGMVSRAVYGVGAEQDSTKSLLRRRRVLEAHMCAQRNGTLPKSQFYKLVASQAAYGLAPKDIWLARNADFALESIRAELNRRAAVVASDAAKEASATLAAWDAMATKDGRTKPLMHRGTVRNIDNTIKHAQLLLGGAQ